LIILDTWYRTSEDCGIFTLILYNEQYADRV
jgi:hypothetical protein